MRKTFLQDVQIIATQSNLEGTVSSLQPPAAAAALPGNGDDGAGLGETAAAAGQASGGTHAFSRVHCPLCGGSGGRTRVRAGPGEGRAGQREGGERGRCTRVRPVTPADGGNGGGDQGAPTAPGGNNPASQPADRALGPSYREPTD